MSQPVSGAIHGKVVMTHKPVPKLGITAHFVHRDLMDRRRIPMKHARMPNNGTVPKTILPVDSSGNGTEPDRMDGNDTLGDCGAAMCDHADCIRVWRNGKGTQKPDVTKQLEKQYLAISGGDNGMDEDMVVGPQGMWTVGIAYDPLAVAVEHLDIDITNIPLAQFCIDNFYTVELAWSVPDDFLQNFTDGSVWSNADTPDPNNGHYTPLADVGGPGQTASGQSIDGFYRMRTWGARAWVGPNFVASVQPATFVTFSARQFDPATGYDGKGRHITTQAKVWESIGGSPIPASVISAFPPSSGPVTGGPPYGLFLNGIQIANLSGYATLDLAQAAAYTAAKKRHTGITIKDSGSTVVETVWPKHPPTLGDKVNGKELNRLLLLWKDTFLSTSVKSPLVARGVDIHQEINKALTWSESNQGLSVTLPPFVLNLLKILCATATVLPAPYNIIATDLCMLLP